MKVCQTTHLHNVTIEYQITVERDANEFDLVRQCYRRTSINVGSVGKGFDALVDDKENGIGFLGFKYSPLWENQENKERRLVFKVMDFRCIIVGN